MSRGCAAWPWLVMSVKRHVDSGFKTLRHGEGWFRKTRMWSRLFHVSDCSATFLSGVIRCVTCSEGGWNWFSRRNFAAEYFTNIAHMEKLECMIVHCAVLSGCTSVSPKKNNIATPTICAFSKEGEGRREDVTWESTIYTLILSLQLGWLQVHHVYYPHLGEGHCMSHPCPCWWQPDPIACTRENAMCRWWVMV